MMKTAEHEGWEEGQRVTAGAAGTGKIEVEFWILVFQLMFRLVTLVGKGLFYGVFGVFLAVAWLWKKATKKEVYN